MDSIIDSSYIEEYIEDYYVRTIYASIKFTRDKQYSFTRMPLWLVKDRPKELSFQDVKRKDNYVSPDTQDDKKTEEKSILAGINQLEKQVPRDLFMDHNQVIIFYKDQAKRGIKSYLETATFGITKMVDGEKGFANLNMDIKRSKEQLMELIYQP